NGVRELINVQPLSLCHAVYLILLLHILLGQNVLRVLCVYATVRGKAPTDTVVGCAIYGVVSGDGNTPAIWLEHEMRKTFHPHLIPPPSSTVVGAPAAPAAP